MYFEFSIVLLQMQGVKTKSQLLSEELIPSLENVIATKSLKSMKRKRNVGLCLRNSAGTMDSNNGVNTSSMANFG